MARWIKRSPHKTYKQDIGNSVQRLWNPACTLSLLGTSRMQLFLASNLQSQYMKAKYFKMQLILHSRHQLHDYMRSMKLNISTFPPPTQGQHAMFTSSMIVYYFPLSPNLSSVCPSSFPFTCRFTKPKE